MILPLVVGAVAVLATLVYASVLDVRERSVPLRTWYPMYVVGSLGWMNVGVPPAS